MEAQAFILAVGKLRHKDLCEFQVGRITKRETCLTKKICEPGLAYKIAAAESDDLSSIPRNHIVEGEN